MPFYNRSNSFSLIGKPDAVSASVFDKLVWTVDDVARELGCSVRLVQKLVSKGQIPYAKIGRLVRFSRVQISDWLINGGSQ